MPGLVFIRVMNAMQSPVRTSHVARARFSRAVPTTLLTAGPIRVLVSDDPADSMTGTPGAIDLRRNLPSTIIGVKSKRKTDPRSIALSRIRGVRVIEESPEAGRTRQVALAATELLYRGIHSDDNDDMESVQKYSAYIAAAYPHWLAYN